MLACGLFFVLDTVIYVNEPRRVILMFLSHTARNLNAFVLFLLFLSATNDRSEECVLISSDSRRRSHQSMDSLISDSTIVVIRCLLDGALSHILPQQLLAL